MAKSSINFAKAVKGGLAHNDRTQEAPDYLLPPEHRLKNEVDVSAKVASQKIQELHQEAQENYRQKFGQKLQAKSYTWEAVINLNKEHTLQDVKQLVKALEKETGFTSVQIAIHRDEGHINERGVAIHNLHAHVTFFTLDRTTGQQLYRKSMTPKQKKQQPHLQPMNRERLSKLQDITAKVLKMERGKRGSKAVRLGHKAYKVAKKQELAKQKDLKAEISRLRAELKEQGAKREDYAKVEALNRELKADIKAKSLTIDELQAKVAALTTSNTEKDAQIVSYSQELSQKDKQIETLEKKVETLERDAYVLSYDQEMQEPVFKTKDEIISNLENARSYLSNEVRELNEENSTLKSQNSRLNAKISTLPSQDIQNELKTLKSEIKSLKAENINLKTKIKYMTELVGKFIKHVFKREPKTNEAIDELSAKLDELQKQSEKPKSNFDKLEQMQKRAKANEEAVKSPSPSRSNFRSR